MWYKTFILGFILYNMIKSCDPSSIEPYRQLLSIHHITHLSLAIRDIKRDELRTKKKKESILLSPFSAWVCAPFIEQLAHNTNIPSRSIAYLLQAKKYISVNNKFLRTMQTQRLTPRTKRKYIEENVKTGKVTPYYIKKSEASFAGMQTSESISENIRKGEASVNYSVGSNDNYSRKKKVTHNEIYTPLWYVSRHVMLLECLLEHGANPNIGYNIYKESLLMVWANYHHRLLFPHPKNSSKRVDILTLETYFNSIKRPNEREQYCKENNLKHVDGLLYPEQLLPILRNLLIYKANLYHKDKYNKTVFDYLPKYRPWVANLLSLYQ